MAFSFLSLLSCKAQANLSVIEFANMLATDASVQLVDVRTPEEFAEGHIGGAVNIDWKGEDFAERAQTVLSKERPVMVYCRSGRRSADAAGALDVLGFKVYNLDGGILAWTEAGKRISKYEVERFWTPGGKAVEITLIKHGSLEIAYNGLSIQFDPVSGYGKPTDYAAEFPKADVILVTHEHGDHLDAGAIEALTREAGVSREAGDSGTAGEAGVSGEATLLILNETSQKKIGRGEIIRNGESRQLPGGILLEAVPAYNTTPGRERFHPKGNGNGYVLTIDGLRIYVAGDTEDLPEMAELKNIDVAFLPVNQPYTMTPEQCIAAARVIRPKVLIPYHYSQTDLSGVPGALPGIDVRIRLMQ